MRERINRLAKGIVDAEVPEVLVLPESLDFTVTAGQVIRKELYVADRCGYFVKGLVYSSHPCVRVLSTSFGGNRNRIFYEIDCRHLSDGDKIEGAFDLVTNGGEKRLPYSFVVEPDPVGKVIAGLKTPEIFAKLVQTEGEFAKRLFEYRDFTDAPFLQDLHARALYDGLKGRPDRRNGLEEFLVGMNAKPAVTLKTDLSVRTYDNSEPDKRDVIRLECSNWGYVRFEVHTDGDFLFIPQDVFTDADFQDGVCEIPFEIDRDYLHHGKNLGAVWIHSMRQKLCVPIEVLAGEEQKSRASFSRREAFGTYLELRLEYELGLYGEALMRNQLHQQLDVIISQYGESLAVNLYQADLKILEGDLVGAGELLDACKEEADSVRKYRPEYAKLHAYLTKQLYGNEEPETEEATDVLAGLRAEFEDGNRSPYLYVRVWKLYQNDPKLLSRLTDLELQVLMFAAKRKLIDEEFATYAAGLVTSAKHGRRLLFRLFTMLYEQYPVTEILNAVCSILIKADCRDKKYFHWYKKALEEGVSLTRLYEYYLYALPEDYPYLLPKEVLLYFSYEKSMDTANREVLYSNIVKFMNPESTLYRQYERDIEQFTMEQLLRSRINSSLVTLYQHVLYKEMIDEQVAKVLPAILKSYRITVSNPNIRSVVVCYEELDREDVISVKDGVAYAPLFSVHPVILFQDEYGNRYTEISYRKQQAMPGHEDKEMEETCYEICPKQPMLLFESCSNIVRNGAKDAVDRRILNSARAELKLHPLFQEKLLECLIDCDSKKEDSDEAKSDIQDYQEQLDINKLSRADRARAIRLLIRQGSDAQAFSIVKEYGWEGMDEDVLLKLCSRLVLNEVSEPDETLLKLSWMLFEDGRRDGAVTDYLCEYFNGTSAQMYQLLDASIKEHVEHYDLPERLLAQMLFSGETTCLDPVYACYRNEKQVSSLISKAYFTQKSADYFLRNRETGDEVFTYLEETVQQIPDRKRIPTIYLMALTLWYSRKETLSEKQKALASDLTGELLAEGRIFAYFHQLGKKIPLSDSIMDQITIEYRGGREGTPKLKIRVLPGDTESRSADFIKVYPGIYVHQHVLFEGEVLEYEVYETGEKGQKKTDTGRLSCDLSETGSKVSRFALLNDMSRCLEEQDSTRLKEKMKEYLTDHAAMEALFSLM